MRSNNNCSISRLIDWFPCIYHQTELQAVVDNRLRRRCGIAPLTIYFLNLSSVNAKLTLLSYVHASRYKIVEDRYKRAKNGLCKGDRDCRHEFIDSVDIRIVTPSCVSVISPINRQISVPVLLQFSSNLEIVIPNYAL